MRNPTSYRDHQQLDAKTGQTQRALIETLLRTRISIQDVQQLSIAPGHHSPVGLTDSPRLLLIRGGRVRYQTGGTARLLRPGTMVHIPPHIRRSWSAVAREPTLLSWCIYQPDNSPEFGTELTIRNDVELDVESAAMDRLSHLMTLAHPTAQLEGEGEIKAVLARLFGEAMLSRVAPAIGRGRGDAPVTAAEILRQAFHEPDILDELPSRVGQSQRYLRERFRQRFDMTPSQYLLQLRMRTARFYLRRQGLAVNTAAALTGFNDPFYFSRLYKRFWGVPPSEDRAKKTDAK